MTGGVDQADALGDLRVLLHDLRIRDGAFLPLVDVDGGILEQGYVADVIGMAVGEHHHVHIVREDLPDLLEGRFDGGPHKIAAGVYHDDVPVVGAYE